MEKLRLAEVGRKIAAVVATVRLAQLTQLSNRRIQLLRHPVSDVAVRGRVHDLAVGLRRSVQTPHDGDLSVLTDLDHAREGLRVHSNLLRDERDATPEVPSSAQLGASRVPSNAEVADGQLKNLHPILWRPLAGEI